jgi:probable FeS assembly SUF system protein SufT
MTGTDTVRLSRDVEASIVPVGDKVTLSEGEEARITQELGGSYTVIVNGNMFRIDGKDADALGKEATASSIRASGDQPATEEDVEKHMWEQMKTVYDPEIPVNVVDLGLIYDCVVEKIPDGDYRAKVKMTLTAPGCGMGPVLQQDLQNKLLCIEEIDEAEVELVWDPPWNQSMMTEAAKLQLGLL